MELEQRIILGRVRGAHGVRGLLRVQPFTEERDTLLGFTDWMLGAGGDLRRARRAGAVCCKRCAAPCDAPDTSGS